MKAPKSKIRLQNIKINYEVHWLYFEDYWICTSKISNLIEKNKSVPAKLLKTYFEILNRHKTRSEGKEKLKNIKMTKEICDYIQSKKIDVKLKKEYLPHNFIETPIINIASNLSGIPNDNIKFNLKKAAPILSGEQKRELILKKIVNLFENIYIKKLDTNDYQKSRINYVFNFLYTNFTIKGKWKFLTIVGLISSKFGQPYDLKEYKKRFTMNGTYKSYNDYLFQIVMSNLEKQNKTLYHSGSTTN